MSRKNLLRLLIIVGALLVLVALAVPLVIDYLAWQELEEVKAELTDRSGGSLALADLAPAPVPDADNAAPEWTAGAEALVLNDEDRERLRSLARASADDWSADDTAAARRLLDGAAPALTLARRAAARPGSNFQLVYDEGFEMEIPELIPQLDLGHLLAAEAGLAVVQDRPGTALRATEALSRQIVALENEAPLIFQLVASALRRAYLQRVHDLALATADPTVLDELAAQLQASRPTLDGLAAAVDGESRAVISYLEASDLRLDPALIDPEAPPLTWRARLTEPLTNARGLRAYLALHDVIDQPYPELRASLGPGGTVEQAGGGPLAYLPNLTSVAVKMRSTTDAHHLAQLAVDVRRRGLSQGTYPGGLGDLPGGKNPATINGEKVSYEVRSDGSVALGLPGIAELWREFFESEGGDVPAPPPLRWELPTLEAAGMVDGEEAVPAG